jgi:hypothetical protein
LRRALCLLLLAAPVLYAQDLIRTLSPDGQLEFDLFVGQPKDSGLSRLAYQVFYQGKRIVDTSWLGIDILHQEPILGQYVGLTTSTTTKNGSASRLVAHYMQNGSLGRLVDIEAVVSNHEVRFRYMIPFSTPVSEPFTIDDEKTEFAVESSAKAMVKISEDPAGKYPHMTLVKGDDSVLVTHLENSFDTSAPVTTPWRVISVR